MKALSSPVTLTLGSPSQLWRLDSCILILPPTSSLFWFIFMCRCVVLQKSGYEHALPSKIIGVTFSKILTVSSVALNLCELCFWLKELKHTVNVLCLTNLCSLVDYLCHPRYPCPLHIGLIWWLWVGSPGWPVIGIDLPERWSESISLHELFLELNFSIFWNGERRESLISCM